LHKSTLLSRGDSGRESVCDDERHCSGVGNDCRDGGDDSGGQSRRISSDGDSNGGSGGLKDSDGFNDDRGFAEICNSESVSEYNGGVWDYVNAVKGAASWVSNSGGAVDIDSGGGVVADSMVLRLMVVMRLVTKRAKQLWKALSLAPVTMQMMVMHVTMWMMAMHVTMQMIVMHVTMRIMVRHVTMRMMAMNLTMQMVALMAMDMLVLVGTALMAVVVLMTLLKLRETTQLKVRI